MKVLVTGGAGYIGSHTVRALVAEGHEVKVLDNLSNGHREAIVDSEVELIEGDLADTPLVDALFARFLPEAVLHFAAFIEVGESVKEPLKYYRNNVAAPMNVLTAMEKYDCKRFIFSSTCATYGVPEVVPIVETEKQAPINPYGHSKHMLERILTDCDHAWGLKSIFLRYFNASGAAFDGQIGEAHDPETHLIPRIMMAIRGEIEKLQIFGTDYDTPDGTCIRDYIHVEDLASAHLAALSYVIEHDKSNCFNLGTGTGISVKEILDATVKITGHPAPVDFGPRREGDSPRLISDCTKSNHELGWKPTKSDVESIIKTAWEWSGKRWNRPTADSKWK
jgi:UDP-glucose 4-epimerase